MQRIVMFSGGAGSWATAKRVKERHPDDPLVLVFADTKAEDPDLYRFLQDSAANLNARLVWLQDGRDLWEVFRDKRFIGNSRLANCSHLLKQKPAREWLEANVQPDDAVIYVGIDWTETHRLASIVEAYKPYRAEAPLTEPPFMDKAAVLEWMRREGIEPPRLYALGFAHNNCGGFCVRAGQAQFKRLLEVFPERYAYHEAQEESMRQMLDRDVSILSEQRQGHKVPLTLRSFRERQESQPGLFDADDWGGCGCFVDSVSH